MEFGSHVGDYSSPLSSRILTHGCSEYPEDQFRELCHMDPVYGTLDLTERDTS